MIDELPKGAVARERSLDLLIDVDEPEALIRELHRIAEVKASRLRGDEHQAWHAIMTGAAEIERALMALNQPKERDSEAEAE